MSLCENKTDWRREIEVCVVRGYELSAREKFDWTSDSEQIQKVMLPEAETSNRLTSRKQLQSKWQQQTSLTGVWFSDPDVKREGWW